MNSWIAYCGLDCQHCQAHIATVRGDTALMRQVAESWSKLNGIPITPDMIPCDGCRMDGKKTPYCQSLCPIRQCAMEKGLDTCGDCHDMAACQKLSPILLHSPEASGNLYRFVTLRDVPDIMDSAADWFHSKWGVPKSAYLACMRAYLNRETEYGWYLCLCHGTIVGGLGVIDNDFHDRKDLTPNVCAVYTEEAHRRRGIAGHLLHMAVEDMRSKGISPVYLVTDHTGFYERYGWEFLCMVQGDGEEEMTRMYIHR